MNQDTMKMTPEDSTTSEVGRKSVAIALKEEQITRDDSVSSGLWREAVAIVVSSWTGRVGLLLVGTFVLIAVFAPWIAPYAPGDDQWLDLVRPGVFPGPSAEHWFGIDSNGRDVFSRVVYGARYSLLIGVVALLVGGSLGTALGFLAGAFGSWTDGIVMRIVDILLSLPSLLLAIAMAAALGQSISSVMIAVGVTAIPIFARLLRGQMLVVRDSDYVLAARSIGVRPIVIAVRHILPNSLTPVIVQGTLFLAIAIIEAAGLAYLGLSTSDPSIAEWGTMLTEAQSHLATTPRLALIPGAAIVLAALGFTLLGEKLREALDPTYRK